MPDRKRYVVQNVVTVANFSKQAIDDMKMLNLIRFRHSRQETSGRVYVYTPAFDIRKTVRN